MQTSLVTQVQESTYLDKKSLMTALSSPLDVIQEINELPEKGGERKMFQSGPEKGEDCYGPLPDVATSHSKFQLNPLARKDDFRAQGGG